MATSLLNFDNVTFSGKLSGMKTIFTAGSGYTPSVYYKKRFDRGIPARTMDIIYDVLRIYKGTFPNLKSYVVETNKGYAAEILRGTDADCAMILKKKDGTYYIKASSMDENDVMTVLSLSGISREVVLLALMPLILEDEEAARIYNEMSDYLEWDEDAQDWIFNDHIADFAMKLNVFSTNVEARLSDGLINVDTNKVSALKQAELNITVKTAFCGVPVKFKPETTAVSVKETQENKEFAGKYAYDTQRIFTEEEKQMMAKLPANYVMPDFVPEICNYFKQSTKFPAPMRVAYLIGPAGTGKTEAANAIFAGLGLPGGHYTCNPATEIFDFIGQVFPNTSDTPVSFDAIRQELNLPSTEDVINDPQTAYEQVYGKKPTSFPDEGAIIVEMMNRVMKYMASKGSGKNFTYVESGLIRAARLGYGFEIQEIGCVLRPGVAVGLNALLETGGNAYITLPTGETIKKHPDCTFVFTSNDEYEGCCNLNQSVLDRMSLVYRIENPPKTAMKERIKARLGFPDESILDRMIDVIYDISQAAKEKGIEDGVCGYRALENWAMAIMIKSMETGFISDAIVYQTAINTVMNKASQKKEYVEELMSSLTCQFAAPNNI